MGSKLSKEGNGDMSKTELRPTVISKWPKCVALGVLEYLSREYGRG